MWKHMRALFLAGDARVFCGVGPLLHAAESTPVPALNVIIMHTGNAWRRMYLVSSLSLPEFTMNFTSSLQATVSQFATRETINNDDRWPFQLRATVHQQLRLITRRRVSQRGTL